MSVADDIKATVEQNKVVIFMKGTTSFPQCGFSARAIQIFQKIGVPFHTVNVLADPNVRQGVKDFSNWPTIPQVYIGGKFVGGSDIIGQLYESGELKKLVDALATS
jgi:monothiol glutaredoxin